MRDRRSHVRHFVNQQVLFSEKRHVVIIVFFTFYFYRPWQWYSTTHARLTDYFNASATQISKWRHWVSCWFCSKHIYTHTYLCTLKIFYQKKGTRWICWHIHYVVVNVIYQIIKLNKCLKDVKKTMSTLRLYIFFNSISLRLYTYADASLS